MNIFSSIARFYTSYINPVLDITILTFLIYWAYKFVIRTNALVVLRAVIYFVIFYLIVVNLLKLETLSWIINRLYPAFLLGAVIILQPEMRKILIKLGQTDWFLTGGKRKFTSVGEVLYAASKLSQQRRGMLVVFMKSAKLEQIVGSGQKLNADLTSNLLITIFEHDTPMHDGACVVQGDKILAAGCFLPVSENYDIKKTYGTRHRAALGLSEQCDAVILVVSEETGAISLAYDSQLHYDLPMETLTKILEKKLVIKNEEKKTEDPEDEHNSAS
ncbi:MAG: diadenylate cyclase CdaA [Treponema sp.]|nr:diadenylate cyclase CdaA [Treponema sp.]MBQ7168207.1 diadenylate cyclase CdaA [Treponema sp.]